MNIIEYFDQTRIINVASRTDRRRGTEAEFQQNNFPINTETTVFFAAITPEDAQGFDNAGVRGCFLSHLGVLKEAEKAAANNVLVLEDDIAFSRHIHAYGPTAISALDTLDWDIAYFGHARGNSDGEPHWKRVDGPMLLAHFYAVNGTAFEKIIPFMEKILERPAGHPEGGPMHYDGALNTFFQKNPDIKAFYFSRNLGHQRPSRTDLHKLPFWDTSAAIKPFTEAFRKLKGIYMKSLS